MAVEFTISTFFPASCSQVYAVWLDSDNHTAMTSGLAHVNAEIGVPFDAWDGYIHGHNLELDPDWRILQAWRTAEFSPDEEGSLLEITIRTEDGGCQMTLSHSNLPDHGMKYKQGWVEAYFEPMQAYFRRG